MTSPEPAARSMGGLFIEIGSGSVKALTVDGTTGRQHTVSRYVGLARLEDGTGRLGVDVLAELDRALAAVLDDLGSDRSSAPSTTVIATDTIRRLADNDAVAQIVARRCGSDLTILTSDQEARLGRQAVRARGVGPNRSPIPEPFVTVDIGAVSTEICGSDTTFSLPLGATTVLTQYLHGDPPRPEELSAALSVIELHLDDLRRQHGDIMAGIDSGTVVGLGAFREIAAVEIGVDIDDQDMATIDGYRLERSGAEEVFRALATEPTADRAFNPGLKAHHVDTIVGALCVMVEFMRQFAVPEIIISTASLLDAQATGVDGAIALGGED